MGQGLGLEWRVCAVHTKGGQMLFLPQLYKSAVLNVKPSYYILSISLALGNHHKAWTAGFLCH